MIRAKEARYNRDRHDITRLWLNQTFYLNAGRFSQAMVGSSLLAGKSLTISVDKIEVVRDWQPSMIIC